MNIFQHHINAAQITYELRLNRLSLNFAVKAINNVRMTSAEKVKLFSILAQNTASSNIEFQMLQSESCLIISYTSYHRNEEIYRIKIKKINRNSL